MSSSFIFFVFVLIVFNVISSGSKKKKNEAKARLREARRRQSEQSSQSASSQSSSGANPWTIQSQEAQQDRAQNQDFASGWQQAAARKAQQRIKDRRDSQMTRQKDPADKNRNRTTKWGERANSSWMSLPNFILLCGALFILANLSGQFPWEFK